MMSTPHDGQIRCDGQPGKEQTTCTPTSEQWEGQGSGSHDAGCSKEPARSSRPLASAEGWALAIWTMYMQTKGSMVWDTRRPRRALCWFTAPSPTLQVG